MKENIILNLDAKGLEVGTKFAIFESITKLSDDSNTDQSETDAEKNTTDSNNDTDVADNATENEENVEKTFVIISLEDSSFEETIANVKDYEAGTLSENGFEVTTSNEDLIMLSKLDAENLQNSIIVINSNYQADNSWDTTNDAVDTKVDLSDLSKEKNNSNGPKYYIKVSYTSNVVAIYTKDDSGEYNNCLLYTSDAADD